MRTLTLARNSVNTHGWNHLVKQHIKTLNIGLEKRLTYSVAPCNSCLKCNLLLLWPLRITASRNAWNLSSVNRPKASNKVSWMSPELCCSRSVPDWRVQAHISHLGPWATIESIVMAVTECCNPSIGLVTKAKGLQKCRPRGSLGVTSHIPGSVRKCEGVNPHTPKATPTLGDGVLVDSQNFREQIKGQNSMACGVLYIIGKLLELRWLKWACIVIWTSETQVMAKRRVGSQTASLTPDQKKLGIDPIYLASDNVPHTVGKLSTKGTTLV